MTIKNFDDRSKMDAPLSFLIIRLNSRQSRIDVCHC